MSSVHRNPSKASERRRRRRQRRSGQEAPQRGGQAPKMAPLQLDPRRTAASTATQAVPTSRIAADTEYGIVRRDLWRLTIYSIACLALMIAVLYVLSI